MRPLRQITGEAHFNEVFFDDVRVPDDQRLDEVGSGWKVALTTLMNERMSIGGAGGGGGRRAGGDNALVRLAKDRGLWSEREHRDRVVDLYVQNRVLVDASRAHGPGSAQSDPRVRSSRCSS